MEICLGLHGPQRNRVEIDDVNPSGHPGRLFFGLAEDHYIKTLKPSGELPSQFRRLENRREYQFEMVAPCQFVFKVLAESPATPSWHPQPIQLQIEWGAESGILLVKTHWFGEWTLELSSVGSDFRLWGVDVSWRAPDWVPNDARLTLWDRLK